MVAETVKSYPMSSYPALIPLSPSVGLSNYSSCSGASLLQTAYPSSYSPPRGLDQKSPQRLSQEDQYRSRLSEGSSLSASGLSISPPHEMSSAAALRKKELLAQRKQREFIPDNKKDDSYWDRRRRNNEAAKRSREKRRFNDMILEQRVVELAKENHILKAQLTAITDKLGIQKESLVNIDQVLASMPQSEQILAFNKRTKLSQAFMTTLKNTPSVTSLLSPNGMCSAGTTPQYSQDMSPGSPNYGYAHSQGGRDSPDQYHSDSMDMDQQTHEESRLRNENRPYSPIKCYENEPQYYEQAALNLSSSRSQASPPCLSSPTPSYSSAEYQSNGDCEISRHSPVSADTGSCLPLKLRHKTHLGEKDAAHSLLALQGIKSEPRDQYAETDSDDRDSGYSHSSSTAASSYPVVDCSRDCNEDLEVENANLRSQIEHLASEVANIKCILGNKSHSPETDSDESR